jgi:hypothetical protein
MEKLFEILERKFNFNNSVLKLELSEVQEIL